jgi:hypothetical protein
MIQILSTFPDAISFWISEFLGNGLCFELLQENVFEAQQGSLLTHLPMNYNGVLLVSMRKALITYAVRNGPSYTDRRARFFHLPQAYRQAIWNSVEARCLVLFPDSMRSQRYLQADRKLKQFEMEKAPRVYVCGTGIFILDLEENYAMVSLVRKHNHYHSTCTAPSMLELARANDACGISNARVNRRMKQLRQQIDAALTDPDQHWPKNAKPVLGDDEKQARVTVVQFVPSATAASSPPEPRTVSDDVLAAERLRLKAEHEQREKERAAAELEKIRAARRADRLAKKKAKAQTPAKGKKGRRKK